MTYVDKAVQTTLAGLAKHPSPTPPPLDAAITTPPPDMPTKNLPLASDAPHPSSQSIAANASLSPETLHKKRPSLVTRISLPEDMEGRRSPPPTHAGLSPPPERNRLHAGHTPLLPRSLSPSQFRDRSGDSTPEHEEVQEDIPLYGPLTLPAQPGDGAEDHIELKVLDAELERIAREQGDQDPQPETVTTGQTAEHGGQRSRLASAVEGHRGSSSDSVEVVDGVILKKPKMNMGAPLGQV